MCNYKIGEVVRNSPDYPGQLSKVVGAPNKLYFLGDYNKKIFENTLAVVGSRAVTMYGEWVVNKIVKEVARCGITIVSGFMYGVDALAHKAALEANGKTIAVMAGGVEAVYPKYQEDLYHEIVEKGLVVSEFAEGGIGGSWAFARRNRIVAGLSFATLVVEAGERSGSLITAGFAREFGRQLLAIPGNLNSRNSFGTTALLRDGAKMVSCADDIVQLYYGDSDNYRQEMCDAFNKRLLLDDEDEVGRPDRGGSLSQQIMDLLHLEPLSADEISIKIQTPITEILRCATGLSVLGQLCEREGRYYVD